MRRSRVLVSLLAAVAMVAAATLPAWSYQEVAVSDGGTIEGKVVFQGAPPSLRTVIPTKDKEVCGDIRKEPRIVLAPDNGVKNAIVYLKDVEKGKAWTKPEKTPAIDNQKCRFTPEIQAVPVGNIEIANSDPVLHNTHGYLGRRTVFNVALPNQGERVKRELKRPGVVEVKCDAHGWMQVWTLVADNPYYAITAEDGTFTIRDVPPGTYTLVAFQSYAGPVETPVTVKAKDTVSLTVELKK